MADKPKQTELKRRPNGTFTVGNKEGNVWPKGTSGNPKGRPPSIMTALRRKLREDPTILDSLADALLDPAQDQSFPHLKEVLERLDGKVADRHRVEYEGDLKRLLLIVAEEVDEAAYLRILERVEVGP